MQIVEVITEFDERFISMNQDDENIVSESQAYAF